MKPKKNLAMGNMQLPTMKISGTISRARAARMIVANAITVVVLHQHRAGPDR